MPVFKQCEQFKHFIVRYYSISDGRFTSLLHDLYQDTELDTQRGFLLELFFESDKFTITILTMVT